MKMARWAHGLRFVKGFNRWPTIYPNVFKYTQNEPAVHGLRYAKRFMNVDDAPWT